jgi:Ni/Co efflux regulator RcnB
MMKKLVSAVVLASVFATAQLPMSFSAVAAEASTEEKKKRPTRLAGPAVGKKVAKAFAAYTAEDMPLALAILTEIKTRKEYDRAYVDRFLAIMYVTLGDNEDKAIAALTKAVAPDILNEADQGEALKLLADLQMQTKAYEKAIRNYGIWMDFTGKEDADTYVKIGQAYSELKQLDKVIEPANKAIIAYGDKKNQNPYILKVMSYYDRKQYKNAIDVLETLVQLFPDKKQWWVQLGNFYMLIEDYDKGMHTLDLAYKQGYIVKESEIKTLASLYSQASAPVKAARLLEKYIDSGLVQRDDKNLFSLANAWHASQEIEKAAKYYGELAKMTNLAKHYSKQGMLLKQSEQFVAAVIALNKALELGAKNKGSIQMSIMEAYFYQGKYKPAYAAVLEAIKDPKTRRSAKGWKSYIKDTADRKNVRI